MRSRVDVRLLFPILIALVLTIAGCGGREEASTDTTVDPAQPQPADPAALGPPASEIAEKIADGLGKVVESSGGGPSAKTVIVFQELHTSRLGQLEIAQMIVRLRDQYRLRRVSLEGAIFDNDRMVSSFVREGSDALTRASDETAVRLLREGEINAAEFVACVFPDVAVRGNEDQAEYAVTLSEEAGGAAMMYLIAIAEQSVSEEQAQEFQGLFESGKRREALDYLMKADPWVQERYALLTSDDRIRSTEEMMATLREIESKAGEVGAQIDDEVRTGFRNYVHFFETASRRSDTIVKNTMAMCDTPDAPVALLIGAAHTARVVELLKNEGASYAVISPLNLDNKGPGTLAYEQYELKIASRSIDQAGMLGALLDPRRKPPPVIQRQWFKSKSEMYLASMLLARAAAGGEKPPFDSVAGELAKLGSIRIDPSSYEVIEVNGKSRVLFRVIARIDDTDPSKTTELWGGSWNEPPKPPTRRDGLAGTTPEPERRRSLEELLTEAREELTKEKEPRERTAREKEASKPARATVLAISKETKAVFATSREEALRRTYESG